MSDNFVQFCEGIDMSSDEEREWAADHLGIFERVEDDETIDDVEDHPEYAEYSRILDLYQIEDTGDKSSFEFDWHVENGVFYLSIDDCGSVDKVTIFMQQYLLKFQPESCLSITWAETCSRSLPGEFGGGGAFITSEEIKWMGAHDWCRKHVAEFRDKE